MALDRIGKYDVVRKVASGGMAEVYLCRLRGEEGFEKKVAVKIILPRYSSDPRFRDLFAREARIAASLVHPNLVQVFDFGREGRSYYLAMEYIEGWNLAQALSQARTRAVPIPLPVWGCWVGGMLAGIGHLHSKGILHRDISPSNILLSRGCVVKVSDFGISGAVRRKPGMEGGLEGKVPYLSPELARGEEASVDSDLFAAAVISAEIFLPRRLFGGRSQEETIALLRDFDGKSLDLSGFPPEAAEVVAKGLSGDRHGRYRDAEEYLQAVSKAVPRIAGRTEYEEFWEELFPGRRSEEEETIVLSPVPDDGKGDIARERWGEYGIPGKRKAKIGAVVAMALVSAAGYGLWKGSADPSKRAASLPPPESSPQTATPGSREGTGAIPSRPDEKKESDRPRAGRQSEMPAASKGSASEPVPSPPVPSKTVLIETDPAGVSVSLEDGTPLGRTPLRIDFSPWIGNSIAFRKDGYVGKSLRAEHLAQVSHYRMELEPQTGSIEVVQAIPWAKVFIGNRYIGDTPIRNLKLPVGIHRLRFVNDPLGVERIQEITVRPGSNPMIIVSLVAKRQGE